MVCSTPSAEFPADATTARDGVLKSVPTAKPWVFARRGSLESEMMTECDDAPFICGRDPVSLASGSGLSHSDSGRRANVLGAEGAGLEEAGPAEPRGTE